MASEPPQFIGRVFAVLLQNRANADAKPGALIASALQRKSLAFNLCTKNGTTTQLKKSFERYSIYQSDVGSYTSEGKGENVMTRPADTMTQKSAFILAELELRVERLELEARIERLRRQEERLQFNRNTGVSLFHGASNVNISGQSAFNVYYGQAGPTAGIILIDAVGKEYNIPEFFAGSFDGFTTALEALFKRPTLEANIQRRYVSAGMYDLCIDDGNRVIPIFGEADWANVEPGTKIVMSVAIGAWPRASGTIYQCPRRGCDTWNDCPLYNAAMDCQGCGCRLQVLDGSDHLSRPKRNVEFTSFMLRDGSKFWDKDSLMIRNIHLTDQRPLAAATIQQLTSDPQNKQYAKPWSRTEVPGYHLLVKKPMDLSTIRKKMEHNLYVQFGDLVDDVQLIVDNSRLYSGDMRQKSAKYLDRQFRTLLLGTEQL
ncbi:hypothetical protein CPB83DRAFT_847104 [Crepidotus variabilis]|uniref:Bromo domain-containing protein n=1 Tax=Crepidotus variabilis TaxID=179855 RepID=A0A9P6EPP8_9AGAR|nr:hypothetical protein CPB83DRAFT_847104 [Crepidotus variabilis]